MIKYLLLALCIFITACATTPTNPEFWMEKEINACLPTAIIFKQSLRKYDIWSEVFKYSWKDSATGKLKGHAMVVYLYPPGKNQLWTYDSMGSYKTRAFTNNVQQIAQQAHYLRGSKETVFWSEFIK